MYEFQLVGGAEKIERFFPMSQAPAIGKRIQHNGKTYMRIVSVAQIDADVANRARGYPYVSSALPRNLPGADHTADGKPIIRSRTHEKNVMAQHGLVRT
jgi:hypothetical protein